VFGFSLAGGGACFAIGLFRLTRLFAIDKKNV
jgi:hypothetical protein